MCSSTGESGSETLRGKRSEMASLALVLQERQMEGDWGIEALRGRLSEGDSLGHTLRGWDFKAEVVRGGERGGTSPGDAADSLDHADAGRLELLTEEEPVAADVEGSGQEAGTS